MAPDCARWVGRQGLRAAGDQASDHCLTRTARTRTVSIRAGPRGIRGANRSFSTSFTKLQFSRLLQTFQNVSRRRQDGRIRLLKPDPSILGNLPHRRLVGGGQRHAMLSWRAGQSLSSLSFFITRAAWQAPAGAVSVAAALFSVAFAQERSHIELQAPSSAPPPLAERPRAVEHPGLVAGAPFEPLSAAGRAEWWAERVWGWESFGAGIAKGAVRTWWLTAPESWGASWEGFGKRTGTRQVETAIARGIEAGLGALWDEDPRYFRSARQDVPGRLRHAVVSAFLASDSRGKPRPAFARGIGMVSAKAVSRTWRQEAGWWRASIEPLGAGFAGRIASNLAREFLPELTRKLLRRERK